MKESRAGFFASLYNSVFNFSFYKTVSKENIAIGFAYLSKLILITALFLSLRYSIDFGRFTDTIIDWYDTTIGKVEIKDGEVVFDKPQPFKVEKLGFIFSVDTTGSVNTVEGNWGFLFTKNKFIYRDKTGRFTERVFQQSDNVVFDKKLFSKLKDAFFGIACVIIFIITYLGSFLSKLIQISLFSVFGLIVNLTSSTNLKYRSLFNIGLYGLTPSIILGLINAVFKINIPYFWIIYSGIYMIFIIMGIMNCKE